MPGRRTLSKRASKADAELRDASDSEEDESSVVVGVIDKPHGRKRKLTSSLDADSERQLIKEVESRPPIWRINGKAVRRGVRSAALAEVDSACGLHAGTAAVEWRKLARAYATHISAEKSEAHASFPYEKEMEFYREEAEEMLCARSRAREEARQKRESEPRKKRRRRSRVRSPATSTDEGEEEEWNEGEDGDEQRGEREEGMEEDEEESQCTDAIVVRENESPRDEFGGSREAPPTKPPARPPTKHSRFAGRQLSTTPDEPQDASASLMRAMSAVFAPLRLCASLFDPSELRELLLSEREAIKNLDRNMSRFAVEHLSHEHDAWSEELFAVAADLLHCSKRLFNEALLMRTTAFHTMLPASEGRSSPRPSSRVPMGAAPGRSTRVDQNRVHIQELKLNTDELSNGSIIESRSATRVSPTTGRSTLSAEPSTSSCSVDKDIKKEVAEEDVSVVGEVIQKIVCIPRQSGETRAVPLMVKRVFAPRGSGPSHQSNAIPGTIVNPGTVLDQKRIPMVEPIPGVSSSGYGTCPYCEGQFVRNGMLAHVRNMHRERFAEFAPFGCTEPECDYRAPSTCAIRAHKKCSHDEAYISWLKLGRMLLPEGTLCPFCGQRPLRSLGEYVRHVKAMHEDEAAVSDPSIFCNACGACFYYTHDLYAHWKMQNTSCASHAGLIKLYESFLNEKVERKEDLAEEKPTVSSAME